MANKKILTDLDLEGDIDVVGTTSTDSLLVGTATGGIAGSTATINTTSTSTGTNVNTWIDVNRAHSSTATGGTYGAVVRVQSNSSSLDGGVIGANIVGRQKGSGGAEFVYGALTQAEQTGSGDIDFIIADSVRANSSGSGTSTIDYVRGTSITATQENSSSTVNNLQGAHITAELSAGSVGDVDVSILDFDYSAGTITGDFAYLQIQNDTVPTTGGHARAINSDSTLPSVFAGSMESTSFIKTGGTSSQFLKADGSVDSSTYVTSASIPTATSDLTNDSGFITDGNTNWNNSYGFITASSLPTNTSDLTNDSGFLSSVTGDWTGTFDGQEGSHYLNYNNLTNKPTLFDGAYSSLTGAPTIPSGNSIIDWTIDQGATNIHSGNYTNTTYSSSDFTHDDLTGFVANEHIDWTTDQGATNIHSGNYTNTTYSSSDFTHDDLTGFVANEHIDWTTDQGSTNIHSGNYTNTTYTNVSEFTNDAGYTTFDGAYSSLSGLPTLAPSNAEQNVQSDWNATSGDALILNKPTLFDGAYSSLSGLPTLFDGAYGSLTGAPDLSDYIEADAAGDVSIGTTTNFYQLNLGDSGGAGKSIYATGKIFADCFQSVTTMKVGSDLIMGNTTSGNMLRENLTGFTSISGGTNVTTGGAILLYGDSNASHADNIVFRNSSGETMRTNSSKNTEFYGSILSTGNISVQEGKKMIFDIDGDSFANIFHDVDGTGKMIYNSLDEHHFKNGDDGQYDNVVAGSFKKDGGTSSQFLKADGTIDSSTYLTSSSTQSKYIRSDANDTTTGILTMSSSSTFPLLLNGTSTNYTAIAIKNTNGGHAGIYMDGSNGDISGSDYASILHRDEGYIEYKIGTASAMPYHSFQGGNVGVGTTSPDAKLEVISGSNDGIRVKQSDTANTWNRIGMLSYVTQAQANALEDSSYFFTTNPSGQSETAFSKFGGTVIQGRDDGNSSFAIRLGNGSGHSTKMFINSAGVTTFENTVTATNFILSSDSRLKENVEEVDNKSINVDWKTFEMKSNKGQKRYGVIAQELEEVHPEFVRTDDEGMKSVAYVDLLIAKIAELEARLAKVENK